jgi:WD40 repeat protein
LLAGIFIDRPLSQGETVNPELDVSSRDGLLRRAVDFVFGYDFFLSYSHGDGLDYPRELKSRLQLAGFKVFLDQSEYVPGIDLRRETRRQVAKSAKMVVIGGPAALRSKWVRHEVDVALERGRTPIIIDINGDVASAPADAELAAIARAHHWLRLEETRADADAPPSDRAVAEIIRAFDATRQDSKRQRIFAAVALVFAAATAVALWEADEAYRQKQLAQQREREAIVQRNAAQTTQSRFLLEQSNPARSRDPLEAALLAAAALPNADQGNDRPYLPAAELALFSAIEDGWAKRLLMTPGETADVAGFSPGGKRIISLSTLTHYRSDGSELTESLARLWDSQSGRLIARVDNVQLKTLKDTGQADWRKLFSSDGGRLVLLTNDNTARVLRLDSGAVVATLTGHSKPIVGAIFSPKGSRILTTAQDNSARLWNSNTGQELGTLSGNGNDAICSAAFNPDGTRIILTYNSGIARLFDVERPHQSIVLDRWQAPTVTRSDPDGPPPLDFAAGCAGISAAFSPDGRRILTRVGENPAKLWDAASLAVVAALDAPDGLAQSMMFDATGSRIITVAVKSAWLWDGITGAALGRLDGDVTSASFSPDGQHILSLSGSDTVVLWDAATRKASAILTADAKILLTAFSPDGHLVLATTADHKVRLWDAASGKLLADFRGHEGPVWSAQFSPDGRSIVTARGSGPTPMFAQANPQPIAPDPRPQLSQPWPDSGIPQPPPGMVSAQPVSAVPSDDEATVRVWDATARRELAVLHGNVGTLWGGTFNPDGSRLATVSGAFESGVGGRETDHACVPDPSPLSYGARQPSGPDTGNTLLWDGHFGKLVAVLAGHTDTVWTAAFSVDGRLLVTASEDKTARLWRGRTGEALGEFVGHSGAVRQASFNPEGNRIVTASADHTARVWDVATKTPLLVLQGHNALLCQAVFSPKGDRIATASLDYTARLWDSKSGQQIAILNHDGPVWSVAFSIDGSRLVTASGDRTAKIWDVATGRLLSVLKAPSDQPPGIEPAPPGPSRSGEIAGADPSRGYAAVSSNGAWIITIFGDSTAEIWDIRNGRLVVVLKGHFAPILSASFSPDGRRALTTAADHTARLWDVETGEPVAILTGHEGAVRNAAFSADGSQVATVSSDQSTRLWRVFPSAKRAVGFLQAESPVCLTPRQRARVFLDDVPPPDWCIQRDKWPYDTPAWQDWLAAKRAGKALPPPN